MAQIQIAETQRRSRRPLTISEVQFTGGTVMVDFDLMLHSGSGDFPHYKNRWEGKTLDVLFSNSESSLLREILMALMADDTGVETVMCKRYNITISKSHAVSDERILEMICTAARRAGFGPVSLRRK